MWGYGLLLSVQMLVWVLVWMMVRMLVPMWAQKIEKDICMWNELLDIDSNAKIIYVVIYYDLWMRMHHKQQINYLADYALPKVLWIREKCR